MSVYTTSASTPGGATLTGVLDTSTNLISYTFTNSRGVVVASAQVSIDRARAGDLSDVVIAIRNQWQQNDPNLPGPREFVNGTRDTLRTVTNELLRLAAEAVATSEETGQPPPQQTAPPPVPSPTPPAPPPPDPGLESPPPVATPGTVTPPPPGPVENPEPDDVPPEELDGYGYTIPPEEPITSPEPETVADPEELDGYGYTIPPEDDGPTLLTPETVPDPDTEGYGDASQRGIPVYGEDGTYSGFNRNPETGELYDPFQRAENSEPNSSPAQGYQGLVSDTEQARASTDVADQSQANNLGDWRVKLSLASEANYLYKANPPGILAPLAATNGVIFPYTPAIGINYSAVYDSYSPVHNNYKYHTYTSSAVENLSITADFTAQDTYEANYLLAVIHFFRALTKMFYGQDNDPKNGTPPPLVFINGLGAFQFNNHPLLVQNFSYNLPSDVDYIRANVAETSTVSSSTSSSRLGNQIEPGGTVKRAVVNPSQSSTPSYVPTKIQIQLSVLPVVTRNQISNTFSLKDYATGKLIKGNQNATGGIW